MGSQHLREKLYSSARNVALASLLATLAGCMPHVAQAGTATIGDGVVDHGDSDTVPVDHPNSHRTARTIQGQQSRASAGLLGSFGGSTGFSDTGPARLSQVPETGPNPPVPPICHLCP